MKSLHDGNDIKRARAEWINLIVGACIACLWPWPAAGLKEWAALLWLLALLLRASCFASAAVLRASVARRRFDGDVVGDAHGGKEVRRWFVAKKSENWREGKQYPYIHTNFHSRQSTVDS